MVTAQQSYKISFYQATVTIEAARGAVDEHLVIDRSSGAVRAVSTSDTVNAFSAAPQRTISAHGIMGLINLQRGPYIVLVTGREAVGSVGTSTVYRVSETKVVKVAADNRVVQGFDAVDEATYVRLLESALAVKSFYFSYDMDLTSSLERQQQQQQQQSGGQSLYATANDEFFFNKYLAEPLIAAASSSQKAGVFVLPMIHGFFVCKQVMIRGTAFNYVLITRRGRKRQGTRYFSRGADEDGNVSNFAETEQIVDFVALNASTSDPNLAGVQMAYVQVRGSIPLLWAQVINMRYVPTLKVDTDASRERFSKHITRMLDMYNEVVSVNLVNKVKYEKPMGDAFAKLSSDFKSPNYHYTHFDFHKECSKMRWERISILLDELAEYNTRFGYFKMKHGVKAPGQTAAASAAAPTEESAAANGTTGPSKLQEGVIRTNCMDCLDRTNVVQSELARAILTRQLREAGVFSDTDAIAIFPALQSMLNNVWADNADAVSCAYSGTGALKTDFTRTGKRTKMGALQDGRNSVERYVRGNFFDGERQDAIDLLVGAYRVQTGSGAGPFADEQTLEGKALLGTVYVCLFMLVYAFFYPRDGRWFSLSNVVFTSSWLAVLALVFVAVKGSHTAELLNWPRLVANPNRPAVMHANSALTLPLLDRLLSSPEKKAALRSDDMKKAWPPTDKKLA
ncbi:Phosphoinositide phosphatase sac1 [Coemansia sp. IMI 209127]|nr:Phosphoinositide phosphatase sac1 [Coemansia sp. IMI 209127]